MNPSGNTMLITGGGSGIGRELARRFHDLGNFVIVAGRRRAMLEETIGDRRDMAAIVGDVGDAAAVTALADRLLAEHPALNVVVHNAGVMEIEDITTRRDLAAAEATVAINLLGPIRLTDALIDHLKAQPEAAIVTVTSGLAFTPLAFGATYSATKAAIHSYTQSLRHLLRGRVEVIELVPPGVQTDLTPGQATRPGYLPLADFVDEVMRLFAAEPTPEEILVGRVRPNRFAERDGTLEGKVDGLVDMYRRTVLDGG